MTEQMIAEPLMSHKSTILVSTERLISIPLEPGHSFKSNKISTSKYNILTFLPKSLWYQFHKLANIYFLMIAILQLLPEISVTEGVPTILLPLLIVLVVSGFKDILEDRKRKKSDNEENNRKVLIRRRGWETILWKEVKVGDIIKIEKDQFFPADLLLLTTSEPKGICYIESKNLDGETNLKHKIANKDTYALFSEDSLFDSFRGNIRCEDPNPMIYQFSGVLKLDESTFVSVSSGQFLLRGSSLKNTEWAVGIAVYTGHESKIMLNSSSAINKFSQIERDMSRQIIYIFMLNIVLCLVCALYYAIWHNQYKDQAVYLELNRDSFESPIVIFLLMFFSWLLNLSNFVPISMFVSVEIVRFFQAMFIGFDIKIYHEETDTLAEVHSSNLNEELGQVSHIFSDKTGTLTCNVMEFRKFSLNGRAYGTEERMPVSSKLSNVDFVDPSFIPTDQTSIDFFLCLAVCHTILAENGEDYKASSPDELALVNAAKFFDVTFMDRDVDQNLRIRIGKEDINVSLLNVIEFSSDRKRMSVVVRLPNGTLRLICKGADSVLKPRIQDSSVLAATMDHLELFGNEGLRTLLITYKDLDEGFYLQWNAKYQQALNDIHKRDKKIDALGEEIEQDLTVLGATAIEDKLQDYVPETIGKLRNTGIKVWVLTGDKIETAMNIGFSCNLLTPEMIRLEVVSTRTADVKEEIKNAQFILRSKPIESFALIVSGDALLKIYKEDLGKMFLKITDYCSVVLACRVSPQQKADIVDMVRKDKPSVRTLSIGDGANDVNMILAAHVGIGISGLEGKQAARASDFAISQFSFLRRLLFVHGRESYRKNSILIIYNFYKNVLLVMPLLFYGVFSVFSGQKLYNIWTYQSFNVLYVTLPIILYAIFDRDLPFEILEEDSSCYALGMNSLLFNTWEFWSWILEATIQGFVILAVSVFIICSNPTEEGYIGSMSVVAIMIFGLVVILANIKIFLFSYTHYWFTLTILVLSVVAYFGSIYIITDTLPIGTYLDNYDSRGSTSQLLNNENFYIGSFFVVVVCFFLQPIFKHARILNNLRTPNKETEESQTIEDVSVIESKRDEDFQELNEEEKRIAQESIRKFSDTGFAYSGEPGHAPQITDPNFRN